MREEFECCTVIRRNFVDVDLRPVDALNDFERGLDNGEVFEPEEIHFKESECCERLCGVLGDDRRIILRRTLERRVMACWFRGNHDAARMHGNVPRLAFELERRFDDLAIGIVSLRCHFELRGFFERIRKFGAGALRNQLRELIHLCKRHTVRATDILHRGAGGKGSECADLHDVIATVFIRHIREHFVTARICEIEIDIRHFDAFGV